jgi:heme/copper-type cytochrome/quinol oxidase subunit 4
VVHTNIIININSFVELVGIHKMEILIGVIFALLIFFVTYGKEIVKDLKIRLLFAFGLTGILILIYIFLTMDSEITSPESMKLMYAIIVLIVTTFGGWVTSIIKGYFDNKKRKSELTVISTDMANSFRGFETQLVKIDRKVDKINEEDKFRNKLRNSVRSKAAQIVDLSGGLEPGFKHVMMIWCNKIIEFALIYNYSQFRGEDNRDEMYSYLQVDFRSKQAVMKNVTNDFIKGIRVFPKEKDRSQRGVLFSDLLDKSGIFNQFEILIMTLSQNGLENSDIIKIFTKFIETFFKDYQKDVLIWKTLGIKNEIHV